MFRPVVVCLCVAVTCVSLSNRAEAAEWFVAAGGTGNGSQSAPFGRIQAGINAAQPGDTVTIASGTYNERLQTVRNGASGLPIRVRAAGSRGSVTVTASGRVLTIVHAYFTVQGLVFDGQYGLDDTIRIGNSASYLTLDNIEVRRSTNDLIDMGAPQHVVIENSLVHHALNAAGGRTDAHGIVAGPVQDLTIRNTEIHTFSGDGFQVDPGRSSPGWNNVTLENDRIWLAPLPGAENGFAAGTVPGENAVDTKASASYPRARLTIRNTIAYGFRNGLITNMAAFNLKENVDVTVDQVTVYDSEIAFRNRGATTGGASVTVKNAVVYNVTTAFRYEGNIDRLRVWNTTIGRNVTRAFQAASSNSTGLNVRNTLILGTSRPPEASDPSNMMTGAATFVNAAADNYLLVSGAAAVDAGATLTEVTVDRAGTPRPQGAAYDVGAYELQATTASAASDVVIYGKHADVLYGAWTFLADSTAAGGMSVTQPDTGTARVAQPASAPVNYFEVTTFVQAGQPYRLWLRGKARKNSTRNDAVYVQFSGSVDGSGVPVYTIGTTSALLVELEDCAGCGLKGWGWQDTASGVGILGPLVQFATTGPQVIRIQTAEDGMSIDQIVLSPTTFLNAAPGSAKSDATILPES
jgi:hypothetical protein